MCCEQSTGLPQGREPYGDGASIVVSGRESRLHGHRGVKGAHRRSEAGFPWTGRQGTRDAKRRHAPAHYPRPRQTATVKETRKPESRMMRQVSCPVRRGAGRKGRKDLARSLPSFHATGLWWLLRILHVPGPSMTAYTRHNFRLSGVRQQYPSVKRDKIFVSDTEECDLCVHRWKNYYCVGFCGCWFLLSFILSLVA
jgi:hypothetical protein